MGRSTNEELIEISNIYKILSHLFRREASLNLLTNMINSNFFSNMKTSGFDFLSNANINEDFVQKLAIEYASIFLGPGKHVPPYGSLFHPAETKKGKLWGDTSIQVRNFILDHKIKFEGQDYDGIPDHIGHEFEFMALLLQGMAEALKNNENDKFERLLNSQVKFFNDYLFPWAPLFCEEVKKMASLPFYRELAVLTSDFLTSENERINSNE